MLSAMRRAFIVFSWPRLLCFLAAGVAMGCSDAAAPQAALTLELKSASLSGDTIPDKYSSCKGQDDISPALSWNAPPERTQSFALVVTDKDSPFGFNFVHWVLYDLPAEKRELSEGIAKQGELPDGSRQGPNDYDRIGYVGPCPPGHSAHHYSFVLYALDAKLGLPAGAKVAKVRKAMKGHILATGELIGRYQH